MKASQSFRSRWLHTGMMSVAASLLFFVSPWPAYAEWGLVNGTKNAPTCLIMKSEQHTTIILKIDPRHVRDQVLAVLASNPAWDFEAGIDPGVIGFHTVTDTLQGQPVAGEHGFFFYIPIENMQSWIRSMNGDGFYVTRNGDEIAHFSPDNLKYAFAGLRACAAQGPAKHRPKK